MHVGNMEKGMVPAIAIVGGGIPLAAGIGLGFKMKKSGQVAACFFGDGASSEGAFHEGVNIAAIWNLPVVFVCENNLYGASTRIEKVTRLKNVADKAAAYGIRAETVFGNDVLSVYEAAKRAVEECRGGKGPVLLELLTYRITGHSRRDPRNYQPKEEQQQWKEKEPLGLFKAQMLNRGDITEKDIAEIENKVERQLTEAVELAQREPEPDLRELTTDVFV